MEASSRKSPKEDHPTESTARARDAGHLKKNKELRAMARNEHESLETMVQTLEQQLQ